MAVGGTSVNVTATNWILASGGELASGRIETGEAAEAGRTSGPRATTKTASHGWLAAGVTREFRAASRERWHSKAHPPAWAEQAHRPAGPA